MARQYTAIKRKTEDAIESLINKFKGTSLSGVTFYKGFDFTNALNTPRLEIVCSKAEPEIVGDEVTGNWTCEVSVAITSNYKDTSRSVHEKRIGVVEDVFMRPDVPELVNNLSTIQNYTIFGGIYGWRPLDGEDSTNENEFQSRYGVQVRCCPRRFEKQ
jgi:hypothetical protein